MALKTLIFGVDDMFNQLQPFYIQEVKRGNIEIAAYAVFENGGIRLVDSKNQLGGGRGFARV